MTEAWKSRLPTGQKMVLLALCDNSNDQGECFPSVSMLTEKCSMSERSVFNHISDLEKIGAISRKLRAGRSTIYTLDPCKFCTPANSAPLQPLHPTPATVAPPPLQPLHPTPATVAPITIKEPSCEPSSNQGEGVAADFSSANAPTPVPNFLPGQTLADHTQLVSNADAVVTIAPQSTIPPCPLAELASVYREELPELPQPRMSLFADSKDADALRQRWRWVLTAKHESGSRAGKPLATTQAEGVAWFRRFFGYVAQCDFLTGGNPRGWTADLGWLVKKTNFSKVLQGNFANKTEEVTA